MGGGRGGGRKRDSQRGRKQEKWGKFHNIVQYFVIKKGDEEPGLRWLEKGF